MKIKEIKTSCDVSKLKRLKMICDDDLKNIPYPIPGNDGHHCSIFCGRPGSGKSTLAMSLLIEKTKPVYRGKYDNIIVFIPKHSLASMGDKNPFEDLDKKKVFHTLTPTSLQSAYDQVQNHADIGENTLIFLDDMAAYLKDSNELQKLFNMIVFNRRHLRCSIIFLTQTFRSIPAPVRKSASHLLLWKTSNKAESRAIFEESIDRDKDEADSICKYVFSEKYSFLLIDINNGNMYKNFNELKIDED